MKIVLVLFLVCSFVHADEPQPQPAPPNRVASFFIAQDFINSEIAAHSKSEHVKDMKVELDPNGKQIFFRGIIQIPIEELRAINLEPKLGSFRFQATIKPEVTKKGYLILEFPLAETFFYPTNSKDPKNERVIVPVQLLSVALASIRGYLAALSGDFSGFDRRTEKLTALMKALDHSIAREKNKDALEELKTQRESLRLQLAAVPIERKQIESMSKQVEHILGLTGEKELNLNQELGARKNALVLKVKLGQLAPYLSGVELGGLRILHDKKDGAGQNYFAIDINSTLGEAPQAVSDIKPAPRPPMKVAPSLIVRLNQSIFESETVLSAEKKGAASKIKNLDIQLKDDGLHVSGGWKFLLFSVPFDTIVDFATTQVDVFEIRVREVKIAGLDFEFLSKFILESVKKRFETAMKGMCVFEYVGEEKDHSRALRATIDPKKLVPAFPDLHLVDVDIREREFLLKIGRP